MIRKAALILICLPILHQTLTLTAAAEEINIVVEGNGESSANEVSVENESNITVEQNNSADVINDINVSSDTGNNQANNNGGNTNIQTGDVKTDVNATNENINTNYAQIDTCCNNNTNIKISGNGSNSYNSSNINQTVNSDVNQNNSANVYNNVKNYSNTGKNTANDNYGDILIKTGDIKADSNVINENINNSYAKVAVGKGEVHAVISGNGEGSRNRINYVEVIDSEIKVNNFADIYNNIEHILNTGGNSANDNLGDVAIFTGDVDSSVNVENKNINTSTAITTCLCDKNEVGGPEKPEKPDKPEKPKGENGVPSPSNGGQGGNGGDNGHGNGAILPVTGGLPLTYLFTIILFLIFLLGLYLRFYSGKSPPAVAK